MTDRNNAFNVSFHNALDALPWPVANQQAPVSLRSDDAGASNPNLKEATMTPDHDTLPGVSPKLAQAIARLDAEALALVEAPEGTDLRPLAESLRARIVRALRHLRTLDETTDDYAELDFAIFSARVDLKDMGY